MRLTSSICSFFKSQSKFVLAGVLVLAACQKSTERTADDATGKGNGGNNLKMTKAEVNEIFEKLKPRLTVVFEGLQYLVRAEKALPGSTELSETPEIIPHLKAMFSGNENAKALKDLKTKDNIKLQDDACVDFRGVSNAAAAVVGEIGGEICFSRRIIRNTAPRNFDHAAEIFVLALATHEFSHHFISTGTVESDEKAAQAIQHFVEQALIREIEIPTKEFVTADDSKYIEQFRQHNKDLYESIMEDEPQEGAK